MKQLATSKSRSSAIPAPPNPQRAMLLIGLAGPDQVMVYVPHITQERKVSWFKENDPEH